VLDKKDIEAIKDLLKDTFKTELQPINNKLDKHSVILEELKKNVSTLAEGQQAQREQIDRQFQDLKQDINKDSSLVKSALTNVSADVREMKDGYSDLRSATAQNSLDIQILKNKVR
jgi:ABC-type transporter Mla subunit MlaD